MNAQQAGAAAHRTRHKPGPAEQAKPIALVAGLCGFVIALVAVLVAGNPAAAVLDIVGPAVVAAAFCVAGIVAWRRRPHNGTGLLLIWAGLSFAVAALFGAPLPVLAYAGALARTLPLAATLHLVLAFPSGRLPDRRSRTVAVLGYVVAVGLQVPEVLLTASLGGLPPSFAVLDEPPTVPAAAAAISAVQAVAGVTLLVAAVVVMARRARVSSAAVRAATGPLRWYGPLALAVVAAAAVVGDLAPHAATPVGLIQVLALLGLPLVFLLGLLTGGYGRAGEVREFLAGADTAALSPEALRAALASALGDTGVALAFRREESDSYVTAAGEPVELASLRPRTAVPVRWHERTVGVIAYEADLVADEELVEAVASLAGLLVAHQRLAAELRARLADLAAATVDLRDAQRRIVTAADEERRRIARDLHDGAQQRMVALGLRARRLARRSAGDVALEAEALAAGMASLIEELRALVAGIMPPELELRGLVPAVRSLAAEAPVAIDVTDTGLPQRLPAAVETTAYFVVAEALANVGKHAAARHVGIELRHTGRMLAIEVTDDGTGAADAGAGTGLRGLADRVAALGGTLTVTGEPGRGSTVSAELPCGS